MRQRSVSIWLLAIFQVWLAHAVGYLVHEYAHSFVAFFLHAKANPLALDYSGLSLENLLFLSDIDENVDYAPSSQRVEAMQPLLLPCLAC